eukprot:5325251-Pyramimonas_sp.AAC.1
MAPRRKGVLPPWRLEPECNDMMGYAVPGYRLSRMRVLGHALGGGPTAWGLGKDPSGDAHAMQACGIDATSHLEAQRTRRWNACSLPQEPQRCIAAVIATLMNDALIWK